MNVSKTRAEMLACAAALSERLAGIADPTRRAVLVVACRRNIERLGKGFRRRIELHDAYRHRLPINAREGLERRLSEVLVEARAAVDAAGATPPTRGFGGAAEDPR
jgi:hypothetical protein